MSDEVRQHELFISVIADLLEGCRHVAVGASSPIPAGGALLMRERSQGKARINILGSLQHNHFIDGVEIFDCAAQGRLDAFFIGGGQIDGQANINLIGTGGDYPVNDVRWPGSFGTAYLYHLVPRVILFRPEHTRRVMVEKVDFVSAAGPKDDGVYRPGGPLGLLTELCWFEYQRKSRNFRLASIHPGHTLEEVLDNTGFAFDHADEVPETKSPDAATLEFIRGPLRSMIGETYPRFASQVMAAA
jgi:glutaconate CoA-transferase subunit B